MASAHAVTLELPLVSPRQRDVFQQEYSFLVVTLKPLASRRQGGRGLTGSH